MKKNIYILTGASRATVYGIGTYIEQVVRMIKHSDFSFTIIEFNSSGKEVRLTHENGYDKLNIPSVVYNSQGREKSGEYYARNIAYLLKEYISPEASNLFHLNFMGMDRLVFWLKKMFGAKVILTVHYTDWSFSLMGDQQRLQRILKKTRKKKADPLEESIRSSVKSDQEMIRQCDRVIAIARHSYDSIKEIYGANDDQLVLINNGLEDSYKKYSPSRLSQLKQKYSIDPNERIILFAGRLDDVKGISFLLKAFGGLLKTRTNVRLVIAGEGNFAQWLSESKYFGTKVTFTGRLDKKELSEFYQIATIGVVSSIHEEFGFVATEMMMHALPLIVSDTGGLQEIVDENINGLKVQVKTLNKKRELDVAGLTAQMQYLLDHPDKSKVLGNNARQKFLQKYSLPVWNREMKLIYNL